MLAAAAPALSPALPVQAAARVLAEESASVSTVLSSGKFTTENGRTYCKNADGSNRTGWVRESGSWYYFDQQDGHMRTGWVKDGGKWYYLNTKDGKMVTGWLVLNPSGTKYGYDRQRKVLLYLRRRRCKRLGTERRKMVLLYHRRNSCKKQMDPL